MSQFRKHSIHYFFTLIWIDHYLDLHTICTLNGRNRYLYSIYISKDICIFLIVSSLDKIYEMFTGKSISDGYTFKYIFRSDRILCKQDLSGKGIAWFMRLTCNIPAVPHKSWTILRVEIIVSLNSLTMLAEKKKILKVIPLLFSLSWHW